MKFTVLALALALLAAPSAAPTWAAEPAAAKAAPAKAKAAKGQRAPKAKPAPPDPAPPPVGRLFDYVRSNRDGSEAETIRVWSLGDRVEVAKMRDRCTDAALVTATMDLQSGYARQLVAGRLNRDGTQRRIGVLDYDMTGGRVVAKLDPAAGGMADEAWLGPGPWHLYDYDLASLTVLGPREAKDFSFELAMVWPDDGADFLKAIGRVDLRFSERETHDGRELLRFEVGGPAFAGGGGVIWFDAVGGEIAEAQLSRPNHAGYKDFKLLLVGRARVDEAGWRKTLRGHFEGCP